MISALTNLGYQRAAAEKAVLAARGGKSAQGFDMLFREALGRCEMISCEDAGLPRLFPETGQPRLCNGAKPVFFRQPEVIHVL